MNVALVGRAEPLDAVAGLLGGGESVLVRGARGTGRSAVLAEAVRRHAAGGVRVLATRALAGDEALPGAGLQRLLTPVEGEVRGLPAAESAAFARLFGVDGPDAAPVPLHAAVCSLARRLLDGSRYLFCVDDLDRLDELSRAALTGQDRIAVLASSVSAPACPPMRTVGVDRLSHAESERLLAGLPGIRGHAGARLVLAQAAGNPLALTELARALPPESELDATSTELPVPLRLRRALAPMVDGLDPVRLRAALLAAFATETPGPRVTAALNVLVLPDVWSWLVADGVLRPGPRHRFTHPVIRAAVIERAGLAQSRDARHQLAALLPRPAPTTPAPAKPDPAKPDPAGPDPTGPDPAKPDPARTATTPTGHAPGSVIADGTAAWAWHTARADPSADDRSAAILEHAGNELSRAGRLRAATYALSMAAARSAGPEAAQQRHDRAARHAYLAGDAAWGRRMPADNPSDLPMRLRAVWLRGDEQSRRAVRDELPMASEFMKVWGRAIVEDEDRGGVAQRALHEPERPGRTDRTGPYPRAVALGTMAQARHETALALVQLRRAYELAPVTGVHHPVALGGLAWAHFDAGDLEEARRCAAEVLDVTAGREHGGDVFGDVRAGALATLASVAVLRGDAGHDELFRQAREALVPSRHALYELRLDRAQGLTAGIGGQYGLAFHRLRRSFDAYGHPLHFRVSDLALADLAQVAVVLGREGEVAPIVAAAGPRVRALRSVRTTAIWNRARALLAGPGAEAETFFRLSLADPGSDQWGFERALARMDYAQWLRRRHRPAESRPLLSAARDVFDGAGLTSWRDRAGAELAAASPPPRGTTPADHLTPQQRQVAQLAAQGLTNPQIAARLGLSARTVGTHLSRAYPILGISRRAQLPAVLDPAVVRRTTGR
ncbi:helix-turn-helix transcriptional regulator [Winogradskya humida]|uniref:LuxR family transcriptional regulator n=1 Tax=Winogradskya humida TaxID=113566 RepID=A0ABQ3ZIJ6_9ACTN|nr:LuxR family transcriptional regulator [Actinoplanes humidus]GIE18420.1 LuxR family transcriptional regulator [Actinoplanes humidus]